MWSRKVFFLLVVKIFVTVISTMDYIHIHPFLSTRNKINIHTTLTRARTLSSEVNQIYVTYLSNWAGYWLGDLLPLRCSVLSQKLTYSLLLYLDSGPRSPQLTTHISTQQINGLLFPSHFPSFHLQLQEERVGWGLCSVLRQILDTDHISAMNAVRLGQARQGQAGYYLQMKARKKIFVVSSCIR